MTTTPIGSSLLQALDIIQNFSAEIVFDFHVGKDGCQVEDLLVGQLANAASRVDVEAGQKTRGSVVSNAEERLEGFLQRA